MAEVETLNEVENEVMKKALENLEKKIDMKYSVKIL